MKKLLCFLVPVCLTASAQTVTSQPPTPQININTIANLPAMKIGPNDLLQIAVYESPELSGTVRVNGDGFIRMPMVREAIYTGGLYPGELELRVQQALTYEKLVVDPVVTVNVAEYQSRSVSVVGEVHHPLTFQAIGNVTLLDAIAKAEGISETAGDEVLVSDGKGRPASPARRIPVRELMSGKSPELNIVLHGGEEIRIPQGGHLSVVGNVRKPGLFPISRDEQPTVLNAIAETQGLAQFASKRAYIYRTVDTQKTKQEIPVELAKIMDRKAPDVPLQAGDILYVPDDHSKRATLGLVDKLIGLGSITSSAVVYAGER
jgi:polysaccharide biosynthesis/export protein